MSLCVINLGLPKTGTTTLARALRRTGLKTADHRIRAHQTENTALHTRFVADLLYSAYFETGDPLHSLKEFQAFSEISLLRDGQSLWPQTDFALLRAIRANNPGVKFLASRRDAFALSQSMLAWSDLGMNRLPKSAIPGLPPGYGETTKERMQWIEGHYDTLAAFFAGDPDFLEYDIADAGAPQKISAFLGISITWWGHSNANMMAQDS